MHARFERDRTFRTGNPAPLAAALVFFSVIPAIAADPEDVSQRAPALLAERCGNCHGAQQREGGLRFLGPADLVTRNDSGEPAVVPGAAAASELIRRVTAEEDERMPPEGAPLSPGEIDLLKRWIDAGVDWPAAAALPQHWAYVPPRRPEIPVVAGPDGKQVLNPIDALILDELARNAPQLRPSPPADPGRLLRRVSLDLVGLPPTLEQLERFLKDPSPEQYERIVDELLNSPQYGEKWARHWLDLARYADSNGFQADQFRAIWPYRDWIVRALNADMPYDQFTIEQLAGDLLPDATVDQRIATGFHRCTTCNVEAGVDPEENRVNQVIDRVNTTGTVWLGTTLECAQCHNHKYDPFSQQEYYQLLSFFNNTPLEVKPLAENSTTFELSGPLMEIPIPDSDRLELEALESQRAALQNVIQNRRDELDQQQTEWETALKEEDSTPEDIRRLLAIDVEKRTPAQQRRLAAYRDQGDAEMSRLTSSQAELDSRILELRPDTTLVMSELDEPRMTRIFKRGNFLDTGAEVQPQTPAALHAFDSQEGAADRLAFARWLVSRENPLAARVAVNRWWAEFFGRGLVESLEDFGTQADPPSHPRLLDWLAVELMDGGWSMKRMHRMIALSAAYQQDSSVSTAAREIDPLNRWLARGPRFRLPAETVRDNALAISGLLSLKMGGPPVYPPQPPGLWRHVGRNAPKYQTSEDEDRFRRGLYVVWRRSAPYPSFTNFDAPDRGACVVKRSVTNTPLQALTLLNDAAYLEMARALGRRILQEAGDDDRARIEHGFRLAVARLPVSEETATLLDFVSEERDRLRTTPQTARRLAQVGPKVPEAAAVEQAIWFEVANILLNLDETITRN